MNRRGFIAGLTAASAAVGSGALFTFFVNNVRRDVARGHLIVVPRDAQKIYRLMGKPAKVRVVNPGGMLGGFRADYIAMDENWDYTANSYTMASMYYAWFNECVRTRAAPGCQWESMSWDTESFDYDNTIGHRVAFKTDKEVIQQAMRQHKRREDMTGHDFLVLKAMLLNWWLAKRLYRA